MWVVANGVEKDAVTLAWGKVESAECYELQLKVGDEDDDFKTVSDKLTSTMVCVRNSPMTKVCHAKWPSMPAPWTCACN